MERRDDLARVHVSGITFDFEYGELWRGIHRRNPLSFKKPYSWTVYKDRDVYMAEDWRGRIRYEDDDASEVINACINAISTEGGVIFIRSGTYTLSTPISITSSNISLIGEGKETTILNGQISDDYTIKIEGEPYPNRLAHLRIENMTIASISPSSRISNGIFMKNVKYSVFRDLRFRALREYAFYMGSEETYSSITSCLFENLEIEGIGTDTVPSTGLYLLQVDDCRFVHTEVACGTYGDKDIHVHSCKHLSFLGGFCGQSNYGFYIDSGSWTPIYNLVIKQFNFENLARDIIYVVTTDRGIFNLRIEDCSFHEPNTGYRAIKLGGSIAIYSTEIVNNYFLGTAEIIEVGSVCSYTKILGNDLKSSDNIIDNGTNTIIRYNRNYPTVNSGVATFSGDGTTTTFRIEHGLVSTPSKYVVSPLTPDADASRTITVDDTYITITFDTAPPSGTDNVKFGWWAEV